MSIKRISEHNDGKFIEDVSKVINILVYAASTNAFFHITKKEILKEAQHQKINYYITDSIFVVKRDVMVII